MTHTVSNSAPVSGSHTVKQYAGFGIRGADIPTTGDSGGSPVLNDGILSTSEYYWEVETAPGSGTVTIFPDMTFEHSGADDGSWTWVYRLYWVDADGTNGNATATVTDVFGTAAVVLAIADAVSQHAADNLTLDTSNATFLTVQDAAHAHSSDGTGLSLNTWSPIAAFAQITSDSVATFASRVQPLAAFTQTTFDTTASFAGQVLPLTSFNQVTSDAISTFAANVTPLSAFSITTADTVFAGSAGTVTAGSFTGQTADTVVSGGATSKPTATFSTILSDSIFTGGAGIAGSSNYHAQLEDSIFVGSASVKPICTFSQTSEALVLNGGFSVDNSTVSNFSITLEDAECSFNAQSHPIAYFNIQLDNALFNFGSLYNKSPIYLKYVLPEQQTLKLIVN